MYVEDVEDGKRTYTHIPFLCMLKHVKDVFDGMVGKLSVSAFQNFFRIENPLTIKEVMSQNVCVCSFPIFDIFTYIALQPLGVFDLSLTSSTSSTYIGLYSNDTILRKV